MKPKNRIPDVEVVIAGDIAYESHTTRRPDMSQPERDLILAVLKLAVTDLRLVPHRLRVAMAVRNHGAQGSFALRKQIALSRSVIAWWETVEDRAPFERVGEVVRGMSLDWICHSINVITGRTAFEPRRIRHAIEPDLTRARRAIGSIGRRPEARALIIPLHRSQAVAL